MVKTMVWAREIDRRGIDACCLEGYTLKGRLASGVAVETRTAPVGAQERDETVSAASFSPV